MRPLTNLSVPKSGICGGDRGGQPSTVGRQETAFATILQAGEGTRTPDLSLTRRHIGSRSYAYLACKCASYAARAEERVLADLG